MYDTFCQDFTIKVLWLVEWSPKFKLRRGKPYSLYKDTSKLFQHVLLLSSIRYSFCTLSIQIALPLYSHAKLRVLLSVYHLSFEIWVGSRYLIILSDNKYKEYLIFMLWCCFTLKHILIRKRICTICLWNIYFVITLLGIRLFINWCNLRAGSVEIGYLQIFSYCYVIRHYF